MDKEPEEVLLVAGEFAFELGTQVAELVAAGVAPVLGDRRSEGLQVLLGLDVAVLGKVLDGEGGGLVDLLVDAVEVDEGALLEVLLHEEGPGLSVFLLAALDDLASEHAVVGPHDLVDLEGVVGLVVAEHEVVAGAVVHGPGELHVVLHGLAEALVLLVGEHEVAHFGVRLVQHPTVFQGDALQVAHRALGRGVATDHVLLLEVDHDRGARHDV